MRWELERHDWTQLGEQAIFLPEWIAQFVQTDDDARSNQLLSLIESAVVPVNGPMKMGAAEVASCLVQGLLSATSTSKVDIVYLLFHLAGGAVNDPDPVLARNVQREVELGLPIYGEIAETGTRDERIQCIDLLSFCVRFGGPTAARAISVMRRISALGEDEASSIAVEFEDLTRDGYTI